MTYRHTMIGLGVIATALIAYDISILKLVLYAIFGGL